MLLRTEFIEIRWAQVSSLEATWAFVLLCLTLLLFGVVMAVVGLPPGFVAAAVGFSLSFCLADSPPPACHCCQFDVASYSEAACFCLGRTSTANTTTMAEAIASAVLSATCNAGMPTSTPVQ